MSNTFVLADNSIPPEGRRAKVRQPLGSLAYLDIAPDNGGIILNLSEDGLALQAVSPLYDQKQLQLVIQLPRSEKRVETAAEIVWLGPSNRQAGVRFSNMSAEARMRIREWVEAQTASTADAALLDGVTAEPATAPQSDEAGLPLPHEDGSEREARQQKWLSLIAELEADLERQERRAEAPAEGAADNGPAVVSPPPNAPAARARREIIEWPFAGGISQQSESCPIAPPREEAAGPRSTTDRSFGGPEARSVHPRKSEGIASPAAKAPEDLARYMTDSASGTALDLSPGMGTTEPEFARYRGAVAQDQAKEDLDTQFVESPHRFLRRQVTLLVAFALFSVLCFAIGTWVGRLPTGNRGPTPSASAVHPPPLASSLERSSAGTDNAAKTEGAAEELVSTAPRPEKSATSVRSSDTDTSLDHSAPATPSTKVQSPVERAEVPAPQEPVSEKAATPASGLFSSNSATPAPPTDDDATEQAAVNSAPKIVDGHVLLPSDRFNPCHLTYRVDPVYPPAAQQQGIEGTVKIHLVIAADGSVESEKLISGPPELSSAAMDAAKYWRYLPALLNGQPVPTEREIEIDFHLPH